MEKKNSNILKEIITSSTIHGFPSIFKTDRISLKIIWAICFLASVGSCAYFVIKEILDYLNYDVVTVVQSYYEPKSLFPSVSFCLLNPFVTNVSHQYVYNILLENQFQYVLYPEIALYSGYSDNLYPNIYESQYLVSANLAKPNINDSFKSSFSYSLNEILVSCIYNFVPCYANDFEQFYDFWYGNCFRFNGGKNASDLNVPIKTSSKAGRINGLIVELFTGIEENSFPLIMNSGIHVWVKNASQMPIMYEGLDLSTGTQTNIALTRTFSQKLDEPYNDCVKNLTSPDSFGSFLFNATLQSYQIYSQTNCFSLCSQQYIIEKCGCHSASDKSPLAEALPCTNLTQVFCVVNWLVEFYYNKTEDCFSSCPVECNSIKFSIATSYSDYPSISYSKYLMKLPKITSKFANSATPLTYESIKRNMVSFAVYYDDLAYTLISEQPKSLISDLVSNIGGTLGLFLGISFLSFIEIFEFGFEAMNLLFEKKPSKVKSFLH